MLCSVCVGVAPMLGLIARVGDSGAVVVVVVHVFGFGRH
jgi:hypothetical protein